MPAPQTDKVHGWVVRRNRFTGRPEAWDAVRLPNGSVYRYSTRTSTLLGKCGRAEAESFTQTWPEGAEHR